MIPSVIIEERGDGMTTDREKKIQTLMNWLNIIGILLTLVLVIYGFKSGLFLDKDKMLAYINQLGIWGPIVFMLIQVAQTVIPIMPGAITIPIGILAFGPIWGMVYNLLPIYLGSVINFWISRIYGRPTVRAIIGKKSYDHMLDLFERRNIGKVIFSLLMFAPFAPADLLCYGAGLTNMSSSYFNWTLLFGKPISLACYAYGTTYLLDFLMNLFK